MLGTQQSFFIQWDATTVIGLATNIKTVGNQEADPWGIIHTIQEENLMKFGRKEDMKNIKGKI